MWSLLYYGYIKSLGTLRVLLCAFMVQKIASYAPTHAAGIFLPLFSQLLPNHCDC